MIMIENNNKNKIIKKKIKTKNDFNKDNNKIMIIKEMIIN